MKTKKHPAGVFSADEALSQYGDELLRMGFLYLKDVSLAQDALQDTFLKASKGKEGFRGDAELKTWLVRIYINCCKDYLRKSKRLKLPGDEALEKMEGGSPETDDTVLSEIMNLKPMYREVILLYYYEGYKSKEIAVITKTSEKNINVRLQRARETLKSRLEGWYYDE